MGSAVSMSERLVDTSDGHALVVRTRPGIGVPVLLLHGLSQQGHFWDPVISRITAPVIAVDQRGHGDSDTPLVADYSIDRCATDAIEVLDAVRDTVETDEVAVIGHSWGAWIAARAGARDPDRIRAIGLLDGALRSPADLGTREQALERLRPPTLGISEAELWQRIGTSDIGPYLDDDIREALRPTFVESEGLLRTRIGIDRHMAVLEGLLDYDASADLARRAEHTHAVVCGSAGDLGTAAQNRLDAIGAALHLQYWAGAIHDVPLQWPALVAGWIASVQSTVHSALPHPTTEGLGDDRVR